MILCGDLARYRDLTVSRWLVLEFLGEELRLTGTQDTIFYGSRGSLKEGAFFLWNILF